MITVIYTVAVTDHCITTYSHVLYFILTELAAASNENPSDPPGGNISPMCFC